MVYICCHLNARLEFAHLIFIIVSCLVSISHLNYNMHAWLLLHNEEIVKKVRLC